MKILTVPTITADLIRAARRSDTYFKGSSDETIENALARYLKFLALAAENPDRPLAPTRDIDWMWHLHMLHPRAYADDCQRIFGRILDHDGGFGADESERPELIRVFSETTALWQAKFDQAYGPSCGGEATSCWHDCQSRCWHDCSSKQVQAHA